MKKMNKKIKENNISTDIQTYKNNKYDIDSQVEDGDTLSITPANEGVIDETLKVPISSVLKNLGISLSDKPKEERNEILGFIRKMIGELKSKYGVGPLLGESDDSGEFNDPDLFGDEEKAEREMNEDFDELMEGLVKKGTLTININENINPRIKKSDLIKFYKNKK